MAPCGTVVWNVLCLYTQRPTKKLPKLTNSQNQALNQALHNFPTKPPSKGVRPCLNQPTYTLNQEPNQPHNFPPKTTSTGVRRQIRRGTATGAVHKGRHHQDLDAPAGRTFGFRGAQWGSCLRTQTDFEVWLWPFFKIRFWWLCLTKTTNGRAFSFQTEWV